MRKLLPNEAAIRLIAERFPDCQGALLAGSVVRGQASPTSDLDIIIVDDSIPHAYRESFFYTDWPVELFAHNKNSYQTFFESDCKRARPSLPRMVLEGTVLKDTGIIEKMKQEANVYLRKGPEPWSQETIRLKRYFLTDALDDFIGNEERDEGLFIANTLADAISEFKLRTSQQWIGTSKWLIRSLKAYDPLFASRFVDAFDVYYKTGDKQYILHLADEVLDPHGGKLFDGFSLGKE